LLSRLLRKSVIATAVSGIGVLALSMGPATAAPGLAVGVVSGGVGLTPGLGGGGPTNPLACSNQRFAFTPIQIAGAVVAAPAVAAGTLVTDPVAGGTTGNLLGPCAPSAGENLLSATGNIDYFTFHSTGGVGNANGTCGTNGVPGSAGHYLRIGGIVLVGLTGCSAAITSPTGNATTSFNVIPNTVATGGLEVVALFQPDNPAENGVTVPFTHALFAGIWGGVGT
jgi:hypothetical protein